MSANYNKIIPLENVGEQEAKSQKLINLELQKALQDKEDVDIHEKIIHKFRSFYRWISTNTWPPEEYEYQAQSYVITDINEKYYYKLNYIQRIFVTLDDPESSKVATILSFIMTIFIFIALVGFIASTQPNNKYIPKTCSNPACDHDILCPNSIVCEPLHDPIYEKLDFICVSIFTIEYLLRLILVPFIPGRIAGMNNTDVEYHTFKHVFYFLIKTENIIDLIAILPTFIGVLTMTDASESSTFVRVLRLARVLRVLKFTNNHQGLMGVLLKTLSDAKPMILIISFLALIGVTFLSAIIFHFEQGIFTVNEDFPEGAFLRPNIRADGMEKSPYTSLEASFYNMVITFCAVGYGDIYPTSSAGRFTACCAGYISLLVIALPVAVLNRHFYKEYQHLNAYLNKKKEEKLQVEVKSKSLLINPKFMKYINVFKKSILVQNTSTRDLNHDYSDETTNLRIADIKELLDLSIGIDQIIRSTRNKGRDEKKHFSNLTEQFEHNESLISSIVLHTEKQTKIIENKIKDDHETDNIISNNRDADESSYNFDTFLDANAQSYFVPVIYNHHFLINDSMSIDFFRTYNLSFLERIFVFFEFNTSCIIAKYFDHLLTIAIVVGVIGTLLGTIREYQYDPTDCEYPVCDNSDLCPGKKICEPSSPLLFEQIDVVCILLFSFDYLARILSCAFVRSRLVGLVPKEFDIYQEKVSDDLSIDPVLEPPPLSGPIQFISYVFSIRNIIDLTTILPFFLGFFVATTSLTFVRILRFTRIIRALKVFKSHQYLAIIQETMEIAIQPLAFLTMIVAIIVILFASVMFLMEGGDFLVTEDFPEGAYMRNNIYGDGIEKSLYVSIPTTMYWTIITSTTVGLGDLYPTSGAGRFLACVVALIGIATIALPITVIGNSFTQVYDKMLRIKAERLNRKAAIKERKMILRARTSSMKNAYDTINNDQFDNGVVSLDLKYLILLGVEYQKLQESYVELEEKFKDIVECTEDSILLTSKSVLTFNEIYNKAERDVENNLKLKKNIIINSNDKNNKYVDNSNQNKILEKQNPPYLASKLNKTDEDISIETIE